MHVLLAYTCRARARRSAPYPVPGGNTRQIAMCVSFDALASIAESSLHASAATLSVWKRSTASGLSALSPDDARPPRARRGRA